MNITKHRKNCETALFKVRIVENVFCRKKGSKGVRMEVEVVKVVELDEVYEVYEYVEVVDRVGG